jgi:PhnO protein
MKTTTTVQFRHLCREDYKKYKELINSYTLSESHFNEFVENVLNKHKHMIIVAETISGSNNNSTTIMVGTGTIFIEEKLTYGGCRMGHIEDIFVHKNHRGNGYGLKIIEELLSIADKNECYRIDLACNDSNVKFYEKLKFSKNTINSMSIFLEHHFK